MGDKNKPLVVAIYGSPRKGGNSEILMDKMLEGVLTHDVLVEKIHPAQLDISPCRECGGCDETGRCVISDDMDSVYPKLLSADYLIVSSPIFFYNLPAGLKALIDRTQANWVEKYRLNKSERNRPTRPGFCILVGGTGGKKLFEGSELTLKYFFDAIDFHVAGKLEFHHIDNKAEILNHPKYLDQAYHAGVNFISG